MTSRVAEKIGFAITAGFLLLVRLCAGQESWEHKVDQWVKAELRAQPIPGLSLAVLTNGQPLIVKGYGLANVEHGVPVKAETLFQSGSMGKQFTAAAVLMLVEEGKLHLEDRITQYFPNAPGSWTNVTLRHLLTHTAGFTDYPGDFDFRRDYTEDELLQRVMAIPLAFTPGEKWSYSNLGYVTLGILIHKVTGKFYGDFLRERIFVPLAMHTARVISEADIVTNRAAGYHLVNGELKNQSWVSPSLNTTADGSLYLSALDMAKWDAALYTEKPLKKSSREQMWTPVTLNNGKTHGYGFGWSLAQSHGHRIVEHDGAWQGFKSQIARYPDDGLTVIVFANLAEAKVERIAHGIAAICKPDLDMPAPVEWVRAGLTTNQAIWGIRGGLQFAIFPGGFTSGDGGPRGLIRIGYPVLPLGVYDLVNFIAIEPIVGRTRGLSELERSRVDGRQGKIFWARAVPSTNARTATYGPGEITSVKPGVEQLTVPLRIEKFDNGAHVRLVLSQRSDAPDELRLVVHAEEDSAPIQSCILTATMGNKARARLLWLKEGPISSLKVFGSYTGPDFTSHAFFPLSRLTRDWHGDAVAAITTDESNPAETTDLPRFWQYRGEKVTQYWRKPAGTFAESLSCAVNARFKYWKSQTPLPGGLAYENFEFVDEFKDGQEFIFGVTRHSPAELLKPADGPTN